MRVYSWRFGVRSYESDAWGFVPTAVILRYLEQTAVGAAAEDGYGEEYHRLHNTAWVVRRLTLLMHSPIPRECELTASTWLSTVAKVRCTREYIIRDAESGRDYYTALTEWEYVNRETQAPMPVPANLATDFEVIGHHLQSYDPPAVPHDENAAPLEFSMQRRAEWSEADSMGHINNTVYPAWLDEAVFLAFENAGRDLAGLRAQGIHPRGEYYNLSYKRSALPGGNVRVTTTLDNPSSSLVSVHQQIAHEDGAELLVASSVYSWLNAG